MIIKNNRLVILFIFLLCLITTSCKTSESNYLVADNSQIYDVNVITQSEEIDVFNSIQYYVTNYQARDYFFDYQDNGAILVINNGENHVLNFDENYSLINDVELQTQSQEVVIWASECDGKIVGVVENDSDQWGSPLSIKIWDFDGNLINLLVDNLFSGEKLISVDMDNGFILLVGQFLVTTVDINNGITNQLSFGDKAILDGVLINNTCYLFECEINSNYPILEEYNIDFSSCENSNYVQLSDNMRNVYDVQLLTESEDAFFVIVDYANIYRYLVNDESMVEVVNPSSYGIAFTNETFYNTNNKLICSYMTNASSLNNIHDNIILEVPTNPTSKDVLNVALVEDDETTSTWVSQSIGMYNLYSSDAIIYTTSIDKAELINNPHMLNNNDFDIIIYPSCFYNSLVKFDYIEDLMPFANDFVDETNMIDSIWSASSINQERYFVTPFVQINVLSGSGELFSDEVVYSFEDLIELNTLLDNSHVIRHNSMERLSQVFTPRLITSHLLSQDEWEEYIDFLQICNSAEYTENYSIRTLIANNELILLNENIGSFASYEVLSNYYGDNMVFPQFNDFKNAQFISDYYVSLVSSSTNKELALEYLNFILSDEFYLSNDALLYNYIPVTQSAFEYANSIQYEAFVNNQVSGASVIQYRGDSEIIYNISPYILSDSEQTYINQVIEDEVGHVIDSHSGIDTSNNPDRYNDVGIQGVGDYENCLVEFITLVDLTDTFYFYDNDEMIIVNEELSAFESGGFDSCYIAELICDRLNTYYSENN